MFSASYGACVCCVRAVVFIDDATPYVVIGTAFVHEEEEEPTKGRIIVCSVLEGELVALYAD